MAGQSAHLSLEEARKMQIAIQHPQSHSRDHGSGSGKKKGMSHENICTKVKHQG